MTVLDGYLSRSHIMVCATGDYFAILKTNTTPRIADKLLTGHQAMKMVGDHFVAMSSFGADAGILFDQNSYLEICNHWGSVCDYFLTTCDHFIITCNHVVTVYNYFATTFCCCWVYGRKVVRIIVWLEYYYMSITGYTIWLMHSSISQWAGGFESWSTQTNDFKIDTCHLLARRSDIIRIGQG